MCSTKQRELTIAAKCFEVAVLSLAILLMPLPVALAQLTSNEFPQALMLQANDSIGVGAGLILVAHPVAAQTSEQEQITKGVVGHSRYSWTNGRAWKVLDGQSKIAFLTGTEEGIYLLLRQSWERTNLDSEKQLLEREAGQLTVTGFRFSDLVQQIDDFYQDSSNVRIPIVDAYIYTLRKLKGAKKQDLDDYAAELRAKYNQ